MITTDDLALKDGVHFTSESYQTIGGRFAEAYLNLIQGWDVLGADEGDAGGAEADVNADGYADFEGRGVGGE